MVCQSQAVGLLENCMQPRGEHDERGLVCECYNQAMHWNGCSLFLQGYLYKMRAVYAHFPINMTMNDTNTEVDIRNFLGEKYTRTVRMLEGVTCKPTGVKDEVKIEGNDLEKVSLSGELSRHEWCGYYVEFFMQLLWYIKLFLLKGRISESFLMEYMSQRRQPLIPSHEHNDFLGKDDYDLHYSFVRTSVIKSCEGH